MHLVGYSLKMIIDAGAILETDEENLSVNTLAVLESLGYQMKTIKKEIKDAAPSANISRVAPEEIKASVVNAAPAENQEAPAPVANVASATDESTRKRKPRATRAEMMARKGEASQSNEPTVDPDDREPKLPSAPVVSTSVVSAPAQSLNRMRNIYDFIAELDECGKAIDLDVVATEIVSKMLKEGYTTVPVFKLCRALEVAFKK